MRLETEASTLLTERERERENKSKQYLNKMLIRQHVFSAKDLSLVYKIKQK